MYNDTYVIIPVYNEATVLEDVLSSLTKHFKHVVCIDDGSSDASVDIIKKFNATLIRHDRNQGQGAALKTGIEYVINQTAAKYIVTFDADGQHNSKDALRLVNYLRARPVDIVLGSRFLGSTKNIGKLRKILLRIAVIFMNLTSGVKLTDAHNGLRAFNRKFAHQLQLRSKGMAHASEIVNKIKEGDFRYAERPVTITYTNYTKSKGQSSLNAFGILREMRQVNQAKQR